MLRKKVIGLLAGATLAAVSVAPAGAETLAGALVGAYRTSGLLDQNRAVLRAADEDLAQAVAALRPVFSWSGDVTRNFGETRNPVTSDWSGEASNSATIGILGQMDLYTGGSRLLKLDAARESILAARFELISVEQEVLLRGVEAFMEVRRATETVALRRNNVRVIGEELRAARDRFEVGEVTRTDVAAAEARLAASRSALAAAEGQLAINREEYKAAIGAYPGALTNPSGLPRLPASVEAAKAQAVRQHPDILRVQHLVAALELAIKITEATMKPTVSLRSTYGVTENFGSRAGSRGGTISIEAGGPIYRGGELSSLVRQAMANRDEGRAQLHELVRAVEQGVASSFAQLRVFQASRDASGQQVRAARVAFNGIREEATLGARTTLDVLDAEQELLDAQAALISAEVDEMIAAYGVLSSVGQLTADALALNVPRYDPEEYYNLVKSAPTLSKQGEDLDRVLRALGKK
ncbi:TolC family outer membrane protein [Salipiger sp.]|uniref:TolC family outer membrane protein n=1 Tax=Salipiger sp. TaxID=2078585 RepID=UPI003A972F73